MNGIGFFIWISLLNIHIFVCGWKIIICYYHISILLKEYTTAFELHTAERSSCCQGLQHCQFVVMQDVHNYPVNYLHYNRISNMVQKRY